MPVLWVNKAVMSMDEVTQQNAALVEEAAAAEESLTEQAANLSQLGEQKTRVEECSQPLAPPGGGAEPRRRLRESNCWKWACAAHKRRLTPWRKPITINRRFQARDISEQTP